MWEGSGRVLDKDSRGVEARRTVRVCACRTNSRAIARSAGEHDGAEIKYRADLIEFQISLPFVFPNVDPVFDPPYFDTLHDGNVGVGLHDA